MVSTFPVHRSCLNQRTLFTSGLLYFKESYVGQSEVPALITSLSNQFFFLIPSHTYSQPIHIPLQNRWFFRLLWTIQFFFNMSQKIFTHNDDNSETYSVKQHSDVPSSCEERSARRRRREGRRRGRKRRRSGSSSDSHSRRNSQKNKAHEEEESTSTLRKKLFTEAISLQDRKWLVTHTNASAFALRFPLNRNLLHILAVWGDIRTLNALIREHCDNSQFSALFAERDATNQRPFDLAHSERKFLFALTLLIESETHITKVKKSRVFAEDPQSASLSFEEVGDGDREKTWTALEYQRVFERQIQIASLKEEDEAEERRQRREEKRAKKKERRGEREVTPEWFDFCAEPKAARERDVVGENDRRYEAFFAQRGDAHDAGSAMLTADDLPWPSLHQDGSLPTPLAAKHSPSVMRQYAKHIFASWHPDKVTQRFSACMDTAEFAIALKRATDLSQQAADLLRA